MYRFLLFSLLSLALYLNPVEAWVDTQNQIDGADHGPRCETTVTSACLVAEIEALLSWNALSPDREALQLALAETQLAAGQIERALRTQQELAAQRSQAKFRISHALHLVMTKDEQRALQQLHEARVMLGDDLLQEPDGLDLAVLFARAGAKTEAQSMFANFLSQNMARMQERPHWRKLMAVSNAQAALGMQREAAESMEVIYRAAQRQSLQASDLGGFFKLWAAISPDRAISEAESVGQKLAPDGQDLALGNLWLELARGLPENHAGRQAMLDRAHAVLRQLPEQQQMRGLSLNLANELLRGGDKLQALDMLEELQAASRQKPLLSERLSGLLPIAASFAMAGRPELERGILVDLHGELAKADENADPALGLIKMVFPARLASAGMVDEAHETIQNSEALAQGAMLKLTADTLVAQGKYGDALRFIRMAEPVESAQAMAEMAVTIEQAGLKNAAP